MGKETVYVPDRAADAFISLIEERQRQEDKWGQQNHNDFEWCAILGEEFGEAAKHVADQRIADGDIVGTTEEEMLREELVQVAAVAVAWVEAIDRRREDHVVLENT